MADIKKAGKAVKNFIEEDKSTRTDKKTFSFFTLAFPTLLIILVESLFPGTWETGLICIAIGFFQFLLIKRFLDDYYAE